MTRYEFGPEATSGHGEQEAVAAAGRPRLVERVVGEPLELGPIEPLVKDASISEVMVNAPDEVYYERDGVIYLSVIRFRYSVHIMRIIDRIIAPLGRRVDETS